MQVANSAPRVLTLYCLDQSLRGIPFTRWRPTCQFWGHNREYPRAWQTCIPWPIKAAPCSKNNNNITQSSSSSSSRVSKMHHWRTVTMMNCSRLLLTIFMSDTRFLPFLHMPGQVSQSTRTHQRPRIAGTSACDVRARWIWILTPRSQPIETQQHLSLLHQTLCKRHWSVLPPQVSYPG